jgi:hypothetical protein
VKIQGFIFNWKAHEARAVELERAIGHCIPVTVINSEELLSCPHHHWVHLGDSAYFSAQWNKALELFEGDILFHIQADAHCGDFEQLFARARSMFQRGDVGVYEPEVDFSGFRYDTSRLRVVDEHVVEVPLIDQTCWFVAGDVLRELPEVDVSANRYGWGISVAVAAVCRLQQKLCVRDYGLAVAHPRGRGYPAEVAGRERDGYLTSLGPRIAGEASRLYEWRSRVSPRLRGEGGQAGERGPELVSHWRHVVP